MKTENQQIIVQGSFSAAGLTNLAVLSYLDAKVYRTADGTRAWPHEGRPRGGIWIDWRRPLDVGQDVHSLVVAFGFYGKKYAITI